MYDSHEMRNNYHVCTKNEMGINMQGWLCCGNLDCTFLADKDGTIDSMRGAVLYSNVDNKFYNDTIKDSKGFFLDGYILNKKELMETFDAAAWESVYKKLTADNSFPAGLRGSFCGFFFNKDERKCFFSDHLGSKALYYYWNKDKFIVSTRLEWLVKVLSYNNIEYHYNEQAAQYMLTYGFMLDDSTFISEVKRILPGSKIIFDEDKLFVEQYYVFSNTQTINVSEDEAIQMIDASFRKAVQSEFEKDREYGYKHLVDLSGGLDSRMVTWVAHDLGYDKQTNFSYCKVGYLDYKISSKIAKNLKHEYYFKALDDFQWIYSIEDILKLNNGAALYSGITGGKDFLSNFDKGQFGIEHTGMIGDVIVSCFAKDEASAYKKPRFGSNQYSNLIKYDFSEGILVKYENQEIFDIYARGFLGAMSTYAIRQNYFEVSSPFLDVDFVETCFRIPVKFRANHNIYLKWINKYYKEAANYGWEKWAGVKPKKNLAVVRDGVFVLRKLKRIFRKLIGYEINDNMNPIDYWYMNDKQVQVFFDQYYNDNINASCFSEELKNDISKLFREGTAGEKTQALTVLGMAKLYFGE